MGFNKEEIAFDAILDHALSRAVNVEPPAGLETRILARLAQRKVRVRKKLEVACVILAAAGVCGFALLRPIHLVPREVSMPLVSVAASAAASGLPSPIHERPRPDAPAVMDSRPAASAKKLRTIQIVTEPEIPEPIPVKPSLIDDLSIPPLKLAEMRLTSLSDLQ